MHNRAANTRRSIVVEVGVGLQAVCLLPVQARSRPATAAMVVSSEAVVDMGGGGED